jgi:mRNA-degrading endonuclease RelE of RelBE toxin-antitoxin system
VKIVRTNRYLKDLRRLGATEAEIARLEVEVVSNPLAGDVIPGLGGLRKLRFGYGGRGKRGGGRAIYFLILVDDVAVMLFAYGKATQEDLTQEQRRAALALIKEMTGGKD